MRKGLLREQKVRGGLHPAFQLESNAQYCGEVGANNYQIERMQFGQHKRGIASPLYESRRNTLGLQDLAVKLCARRVCLDRRLLLYQNKRLSYGRICPTSRRH